MCAVSEERGELCERRQVRGEREIHLEGEREERGEESKWTDALRERCCVSIYF